MIGGIRLEGKKEASLGSWAISRPLPPQRVWIPLNQHQGLAAIPCVSVGTRVRVGQKIADPAGPFSVALHASISGEVTAIDEFAHPVLRRARAVEIHSDGRDEKMPEIGRERTGWADLSAKDLYRIFQHLGVMDLSAEAQSLQAKLLTREQVSIHTLIFNGCSSEPYVTSDYALIMSHPLEILKGAQILRRVVNAKKLIFSLDDSQREAVELLKSKIYFLKWPHAKVEVVSPLYPQGAEIPLIHEISGVDKRALFSGIETGIRVLNVATAFAVYEAVVLQKPLYERVVTVSGECVVEPRNVWVRLGISFADIFKTCRGLLREPGKVLMNGPMKGTAQGDLLAPAVKATQAVLALAKEVTASSEIQPCIRCNRCVEVCPSEISPVMITLAAEKNLFEMARCWGVEYCIECGNCSYICPAKRPMIELIRQARAGLTHSQDFLSSELDDSLDSLGALEKMRKKRENLAEIVTSVAD